MPEQTAPRRKGPNFWWGLFAFNMAAISGAQIFEWIDRTTAYVLFALSLGVLYPAIASAGRRMREHGVGPAMLRYNRRMAIASVLYVLGLGIAVALYKRGVLGPVPSFIIAMLPALPTLGMIWAMARYLVEEQDEYLRHRATLASLIGLGLVLALGSFWGFLETFAVVPHVWSWWVVPVWAIGMGLGQCWQKVRGA
ncbi:hypothetical protein [Novosphingobium album (ex Liu et al. 2023)]|uniref:Uncharacterized protein n=1 Tax=Novosphingobium album (ex Liu et al. 2023) TaxID=3031130 RepID=A0ABT5WV49_9SPHN|nr:hypothetical protein [Novosphingobium album (ex Liu et al. 2023)]MDE8653785.1 hypothetical protein [Novosphingobium album (ex Liu et al. 2023)]